MGLGLRFFNQAIALRPKLAVAIDASDAIFVANRILTTFHRNVFELIAQIPLKKGVIDVDIALEFFTYSRSQKLFDDYGYH